MTRKWFQYLSSLLVVAFAVALAGCQSNPVSSEQRGPESKTGAPITTEAPVDQEDTNQRSAVQVVNVVLPGVGGEKSSPVEISVHVGAKSDGDAKGAGKTESGPQSGTQTADQKPTNTQTNDLSGLVKAAEDLAAQYMTGGFTKSADLAKQAAAAFKAGNKTQGNELLKEAEAAKVEPPAPAPAPGG